MNNITSPEVLREKMLVHYYRDLNVAGRETLMVIARSIGMNPSYQKSLGGLQSLPHETTTPTEHKPAGI